jgi:lipopolysaccharide/colanic/teichoic acid biosynthesis glycosyltransferase
VIIQNEESDYSQNSSLVYFLASRGVNIHFFDDVYETIYGRVLEKNLYSKSLIPYLYSKSDYYDFLKRFTDVCISLFVLVVSLPLWILAFVLIKLETGGDTLLKNNIRIGKGGKKIKVYKFRTMKGDDTGVWVKEEGNKNKVTRVGYFLRKTRIDELPQLINVLKGELSLIGPRPDIVDLGERLSKEIVFYKSRLVARPGLSGWAQIKMNKPPQTVEETKERLLYDLYYIKHRSFTLDLAIALKTIKTLLSREGV